MKPPPKPDACMPLSNGDFERLKSTHPKLWVDPKRECKTCLKQNGNTYHWWADNSRTEIATFECDCTAQWLMHLWFLNAGIGTNYQRLTWDDVASVDAGIVEQIMSYAINAARRVSDGRNLVLWSTSPGTGKTLLLSLLLKALMVQNHQVHFSQFNEIIDLFTSSWRDNAEREQWNRRVRNVDILGIDDMGKEHKGRLEMVEAMVDQIIRARVSDSSPTIITTNLTPQQMQEGYGGYVMSLLSEQADFIEVTGADFRPRRRELTSQEADLGLARPIAAV
ncbi:DnaA/Hda family protein [Streptomyces sp. NBC_01242]|uniref:DnaA ATPase domain-containing protein n=1 Tax=Streptomyces sp. NBC_01242 TaxID=2903795 RepID=UPI002253FAA8|nr:DnaA/Hda family protein [Streptomyces sp. NBC_01242]MCX4799702.1 DnaA/Hda family protein [Streptomyces sp. NBC_01242]